MTKLKVFVILIKFNIKRFIFKRRLCKMDRFLEKNESFLFLMLELEELKELKEQREQEKLEAVNCNECGRVQNAEVGKVGDCERKKPCTVTSMSSWCKKDTRQ